MSNTYPPAQSAMRRPLLTRLLTLAAPPMLAQQPAVRPLGPTVAVLADSLAGVGGVRDLGNGRVLVNDPRSRRLLLLDSTLSIVKVVADTGHAPMRYGARPGALIPYRADSTLFVDVTSASMLVLDASGKVIRVMAVPRSQDLGSLVNPANGGAFFDPAGRLVYRLAPNVGAALRAAQATSGGGEFDVPPPPDSVPVLRVDLASRVVDTAAFLKVPVPRIHAKAAGNGFFDFNETINPLPFSDDWTVLSDGTIAIVRGRDYHVDWYSAGGQHTASPKVPFAWERLTDEQKVVFVDSVRSIRQRIAAEEARAAAAAAAAKPEAPRASSASGAPPERGASATPREPPPVNIVAPNDLPDYKPAFLANSTRADADGNLWIRIQGGTVYDVVSRTGTVVDRVRVPEGRTIVGFGPGGAVYLASRDNGATKLERARIR